MIISKRHNVIPFPKDRTRYLRGMRKGLVIFVKCMVEDVTLNDIKEAWKQRSSSTSRRFA